MKKKEHVPTPDEIWQILKEVSLSQKETDRRMQETDRRMQETDRLIRESKAETERQKKETDRLIRENKQEADRRKQETDRRIKENDQLIRESKAETDRLIQASKAETERQIEENRLFIKQIDSRWGNQWGDLIEVLIAGSLVHVLNKVGIPVERAVPGHKGAYQNKTQEFDVLALNGEQMVVVETKSFLNKTKVNAFLSLMRDFKNYCPEFKHLTVYGGVACLNGREKVFEYAEKKGLFVLQVEGNKNAVLRNKQSFKPEVFGPKPTGK